MPGRAGVSARSSDRDLIRRLQGRAISYFLDNQLSNGLIPDRQANRGPAVTAGPCSIAATGMGLIAVALASAYPHRSLSRAEAIHRVRSALVTGLDRLPQDRGIMPHFVDRYSLEAIGEDVFSTVDSSWFVAGALWASAFLGDGELVDLASQIYKRIDWKSWSTDEDSENPCQIRHGKGPNGRFLKCSWDRINGETVMMYVLAAGAEEDQALSGASWASLRPFYGEVAGHRFNNADLGLFVFQYGLDLLDLRGWKSPDGLDLMAEASVATLANRDACRASADRFRTYRLHWGLSAGDGPGHIPGLDAYHDYSPTGTLDGTAHLTAALASVAHQPEDVLENVRAALTGKRSSALGRYGLSCINDDRQWVARDMVGIDAGAVVLALENYLVEDRVRSVFHGLSCVRRGLERLGFREAPSISRAS